jgi:hypothetical protein
MGIESLRKANPGLTIREAEDPAFSAYGRLLDGRPFAGLAALADRITGIDQGGNRYVASLPELEAEPSSALLSVLFGGMEIEVGYCNGPNSRLNGLEYHKSIEVDIAVTDLVLLLGRKRDIGADGIYDSRRVEGFFFPAGSAILLDPEVLHFSPCRALAGGFKCVVALPRGTNEALSPTELAAAKALVRPEASRGFGGEAEARLLFMRNKWLLAHPERTILVERGAFPGIRGENLEVRLG